MSTGGGEGGRRGREGRGREQRGRTTESVLLKTFMFRTLAGVRFSDFYYYYYLFFSLVYRCYSELLHAFSLNYFRKYKNVKKKKKKN